MEEIKSCLYQLLNTFNHLKGPLKSNINYLTNELA